jgi:hypothetical protein
VDFLLYKIPEAIKLHYQHPPPMLPSMPQDPSAAAVTETDEKSERIPETTLEDQEEVTLCKTEVEIK